MYIGLVLLQCWRVACIDRWDLINQRILVHVLKLSGCWSMNKPQPCWWKLSSTSLPQIDILVIGCFLELWFKCSFTGTRTHFFSTLSTPVVVLSVLSLRPQKPSKLFQHHVHHWPYCSVHCYYQTSFLVTVKEPIPDSLSFKQLSMAFLEICLKNDWLLKIKSAIGPLSVIGASTLEGNWKMQAAPAQTLESFSIALSLLKVQSLS